LIQILDSDILLEQVSAMSYWVTPHFLKLMLHKDQVGWGLRIHSLSHSGTNPLIEPWHEHRWIYGSSVLTGQLTTENGKVIMAEHLDDVNHGPTLYYKYEVPDKRVTGKVQPQFVGRCALAHRFNFNVTTGQSYSSHPDLAHRLVITQPTVTAIVTSHDLREMASFIEEEPLSYAERMLKPALNLDEARELLQLTRDQLMANSHAPIAVTRSPFPELFMAVS
jgi:hypothetical protein